MAHSYPSSSSDWKDTLPSLLSTLREKYSYPSDLNVLVSNYVLPKRYQYVYFRDDETSWLVVLREDGYCFKVNYENNPFALYVDDNTLHRLLIVKGCHNPPEGVTVIVEKLRDTDFDWGWEEVWHSSLSLLLPQIEIEWVVCHPNPFTIHFQRRGFPSPEIYRYKSDREWVYCNGFIPIVNTATTYREILNFNDRVLVQDARIEFSHSTGSYASAVGFNEDNFLCQPCILTPPSYRHFPHLVLIPKRLVIGPITQINMRISEHLWGPSQNELAIPPNAIVTSAGEFLL